MVIWANHNLRASVSAMQQVTKRIYADTSLINIEEKVFHKRLKLVLILIFYFCIR